MRDDEQGRPPVPAKDPIEGVEAAHAERCAGHETPLDRLRAAVRTFTDEGVEGGPMDAPNGPAEEAWDRIEVASKELGEEIGKLRGVLPLSTIILTVRRAGHAHVALTKACADACRAEADQIRELRLAFEAFTGEPLPRTFP